jgi:hypothetical protein
MPNAIARFLRLSFVTVLFIGSAPALGATAQRTFVASTGNDAHPCTLPSPCRGFSAAIAQTSPGGEVIVLDSAGYGPATIAKPVSIVAPAGIYAGVTVTGLGGLTVNAGPDVAVVLRGLTINGQGGVVGISATLDVGARLHVENCVISGLGTGLKAAAVGSSSLFVTDTVIRENSGDGINLVGAPLLVTFERVEVKKNGGNGVHALNGPTVAIRDSSVATNHLSGVYAETTMLTSTRLLVHGSQVNNNGSAGVAANVTDPTGYVIVTVSESNVSDNQSAGISITGVAGHAFLLARGNTLDFNFGGIYVDVLGGGAVATIKDNMVHDGDSGITIGHGGVATIANNAFSLVSWGVEFAMGGATVRSASNNLFNDTVKDVDGGVLTPVTLH